MTNNHKWILYVGFLMNITFIITSVAQQSNDEKSKKRSQVKAVCLWAEDVPELAAFYKDILELEEPIIDFAGRIRFKLDDAVFFILKGKPQAAKSEEPFPLFALSIDDLDMAVVKLKTRNIKMPHGIEGSGRHRELQFYDPAGNLVELVQSG